MRSEDIPDGASVSPAPPGPITVEDKNGFKVMKIGFSTMPYTLSNICIMGSSRDPDQTLEDFFLKGIEMSKTKYKKVFDRNEREKMLSKDMSNLDVKHLFSLIKYGNQKLAGEDDPVWQLKNEDSNRLEWLINAIKNERNDMFHYEPVLTKEQLLAKTDEIRSLLERALQVAGKLYEKESTKVDKIIQKMKSEIIEIRDQDLSQVDIEDYKNLLISEELKNVLKTKGRCELKDTYKKWSQLNPASFVQGENLKLDVKSVFVRLAVQKAGGKENGSLVSFENLIEFCRDNASGAESTLEAEGRTISTPAARGRGKDTPAARRRARGTPAARGRTRSTSAARGRARGTPAARGRTRSTSAARGRGKDTPAAGIRATLPEIFLVEGPGGSGKTTLTKLLLSQWSDETGDILGLDQFDLILLMECRNSRIDSFANLLSHLLPKTNGNHFKPGDLLKCARQLRLLVIIDGLDEMNRSSDLLFKNILETQRTSDLVLLCTSRPEKVGYFHSMVPSEYGKVHLRILGIPDECKEQFLEHYHDQMKAKAKSVQNTQDLLAYLRRSPECLKDHYRLPLNLVLLAWLWAGDPGRVTSITTPTELYTKYLELIEKKLIDRLRHHEKTKEMSEEELKQKIKMYLRALYNEALRALKRDCIEKLPNKSLKTLKAVCNANSLPCEELLPAFLVLKSEGNAQHAIIPHKLEHDFYAALGLMFQLFDQTTRDEVSKKLEDLGSLLSSWNVSTADKVFKVAKAELEREIKGQRPGAIMSLLSDADGGDSAHLDLSKYQSVLVQLAGCLYIQKEHPVQECTAHEVVHLLKRSGMGRCDDDEWFQLLDNTRNDVTITNHVAQEIQGDLYVDDSHVNGAINLLQRGKPKRVILDIEGDPWGIPEFKSLLERLSEGQHPVDIYFHQEFRQPKSQIPHRPALDSVFKRCDVERVMCGLHSDSLLALPSSMRELYFLMATDQQAVHLQADRPGLLTLSPKLEDLYLHMSVSDSPAEEWLSSVRAVPHVHLFLSDVNPDNMAKACRIAQTLQPENGRFQSIRLPGARLGEEDWRQLLLEMKRQCVQIWNCLMLPCNSVLKADKRELQMVARSFPFPYRVRFETEEVIWLSFL